MSEKKEEEGYVTRERESSTKLEGMKITEISTHEKGKSECNLKVEEEEEEKKEEEEDEGEGGRGGGGGGGGEGEKKEKRRGRQASKIEGGRR